MKRVYHTKSIRTKETTIRPIQSSWLRAVVIGLSLSMCLISAVSSQTPPSPESAPIGVLLQRAAPSVHWTADGLLVYSVSEGDSVSHRSINPRTDVDRPYIAPDSPKREEPRIVRPGLFAHRPPVRELPSPDQRWFAGTTDGQVWVRTANTEDRTRLATDGQPEYGYDIEGAKWSPDARLLAVKKLDARDVPTIPIVHWSEPGQPVVRHPYSRAGEPIPRAELYVVDPEGGKPTRVELGDGDAPYLQIFGWSGSGDELYFMRTSRLTDRVELMAADPRTGRSRTILTETSDTFVVGLPLLHGYNMVVDEWLKLMVPLDDGRRFIWTSERDGWRRLYLYDFDGTLIRALTPPDSEVYRLEAVDEERGCVYYTAAVDPDQPYEVSVLRAPLDGGSPERLVAGPTFDRLEFDASRDFFWTMRGGPDRAPVIELRASDGALVRELWSGAEIARAAGWVPPEAFSANAADGETELFGLLFRPRDFDPERSYPVVDHLYLGAFTTQVPRSMLNRTYSTSQALADLGFLVMVVDARGSPLRGKAFQDAFHGRIGQHEIADHAAVLRQLAAERPYMDLERVGAFGHSWGGYAALRAILQEPELFRVAVASAPAVDLEDFRVAVEPYMGCLPDECAEAYEAGSNTRLVDRLQGKLLLLHGTSDDDVPFGDTVGLIDALIRAGKPYDLVVFPEGHHIIQGPYWWQRATSYLREHLQP